MSSEQEKNNMILLTRVQWVWGCLPLGDGEQFLSATGRVIKLFPEKKETQWTFYSSYFILDTQKTVFPRSLTLGKDMQFLLKNDMNMI